jgi:hypothetical protein
MVASSYLFITSAGSVSQSVTYTYLTHLLAYTYLSSHTKQAMYVGWLVPSYITKVATDILGDDT